MMDIIPSAQVRPFNARHAKTHLITSLPGSSWAGQIAQTIVHRTKKFIFAVLKAHYKWLIQPGEFNCAFIPIVLYIFRHTTYEKSVMLLD